MKFKTVATTKLISENPKVDLKLSDDSLSLILFFLQIARSHILKRMRNTKMGCNGRPKRRIFSVVGSNGLMQILDMESQE